MGSESGTAEFAAFTLDKILGFYSYTVIRRDAPRLNDIVKSNNDLVLFVTSTTGNGELPNNLGPLRRKLRTKRPPLTGITYAVTALGGKSYSEDFCRGGLDLDNLLRELGAKQLKEPLLINTEAVSCPEVGVTAWGVNLANESPIKAVRYESGFYPKVPTSNLSSAPK